MPDKIKYINTASTCIYSGVKSAHYFDLNKRFSFSEKRERGKNVKNDKVKRILDHKKVNIQCKEFPGQKRASVCY